MPLKDILTHTPPAPHFRLRTLISLLVVMLTASRCESQYRPPNVELTEKDTVHYQFLHQDSSRIENAEYLEPFFQKLLAQRTGGGQRLTVVHIGDSHIQGDYFTREIRERLQEAFGNAGRGMVFPYRVLGTNGPRDFLVETTASWSGSSCQKNLSQVTPFGLSGFSLETTQPFGALTFRMRDSVTLESNPFTKVTVIYRKTPETYELEVVDDATKQQARRLIEDDFSSTFFFDRPVSQFSILHSQSDPQQKRLQIDAISVENELSGIIYHTVGVNGAKYSDWVRAQYFADQVGLLQPDLIILSMGTNEAQGVYGPKSLYQQMETLVGRLKEAAPNARFLLTTPADSYLRGRGYNPYLPQIVEIIRRYAENNGYALWDLYHLSGGQKSARLWKANGLMASDSVHYSKTGYAAQGKLFYLALTRSYNLFAAMVLDDLREGK